MKTTFIKLLMLMSVLLISCEKVDYTIPSNLNGTVWRCEDVTTTKATFDYIEMRFISSEQVEFWYKYQNESPFLNKTTQYWVLGTQFSINVGGEEGVNIGVIDNDKKTISLNYYIFGNLFFKKR